MQLFQIFVLTQELFFLHKSIAFRCFSINFSKLFSQCFQVSASKKTIQNVEKQENQKQPASLRQQVDSQNGMA